MFPVRRLAATAAISLSLVLGAAPAPNLTQATAAQTTAAQATAAQTTTASTRAPLPVPSTDTGSRVVAAEWIAERQVDLTVESQALGGEQVKVRLLVPKGWKAGHKKQWPTLWLLHGCCGDYTAWTKVTNVASLPELYSTLVVMPTAGNAGWYSNWHNHGKGGAPAWEDFHLKELMPLLESDWGAGPKRAVAGLSMGGLGAMKYAGAHPGMFRAAAAYSGVVSPTTPAGPETILGITKRYVPDPLALWGDPVVDKDVWLKNDPITMVDNLARIPVYLSCGDGTTGPLDKPGVTSQLETDLQAQNLRLAAALREAGADRLTTDFYGSGTHTWKYWERELHDSLPMLLKAMRSGN